MPIAKLTTGKGATGLLKYLQEGRKAGQDRASAWDTNLIGTDRRAWAVEFAKQSRENTRVKSPYLHISVSFDPNDETQRNLSDEQILDFGKSYLERMELQDRQWVMAVHRDREHPHVHIVVNRIDDSGKAYDLSFSKLRFMEGLRDVERDYRLEPPREKNRPYQPDRGERHRPERNGELTWKLDLVARINGAIERCDGTWDGFVALLQRDHVDLRLNSNGRGITFGFLDRVDKDDQPIRMKASTLGKRYRMDGLKQRLADRASELARDPTAQELARNPFEPDTPHDNALDAGVLDAEKENQRPQPTRQRENDSERDRIGLFGGIPYEGLEGLDREDQPNYRAALNLYAASRRDHPAYQRADGNTARQALTIERDLRALVRGKLLALVPKPELIEHVQNAEFVASHLTSPERALDLVVNRLISRSITKALEAAPVAAPLAVAALVAKDVFGALNEMAESEREKQQQVEEEHRHDREWQFVQVNQHEYERER